MQDLVDTLTRIKGNDISPLSNQRNLNGSERREPHYRIFSA